eukprot:89259-Hanusia_phi.AAC.1
MRYLRGSKTTPVGHHPLFLEGVIEEHRAGCERSGVGVARLPMEGEREGVLGASMEGGEEPRMLGAGGMEEAIAVRKEPTTFIEYLEEYGFILLVMAIFLYFMMRKLKESYKNIKLEAKLKSRDDSMRKIRELQQAKYEIETAEKRKHLAEIEEERRKQQLEEMEAASQGRSARKPETKKPKDTRDYWDNTGGFSHLSNGGGDRGYKPSCRRRGG